jgi:superfamily II DNA or RNA helicase
MVVYYDWNLVKVMFISFMLTIMQVFRFWEQVDKLVVFKHKSRLDAMRRMALDKHLNFLVGQTERYSHMLANAVTSPDAATSTDASAGGSNGTQNVSAAASSLGAVQNDSAADTNTHLLLDDAGVTADAATAATADVASDGDYDSQDIASGEEDDDEETLEAEERRRMARKKRKTLQHGSTVAVASAAASGGVDDLVADEASDDGDVDVGDEDGDTDEEVAALQKESEMPIEELRKLYGLDKTDGHSDSEGVSESDGNETDGSGSGTNDEDTDMTAQDTLQNPQPSSEAALAESTTVADTKVTETAAKTDAPAATATATPTTVPTTDVVKAGGSAAEVAVAVPGPDSDAAYKIMLPYLLRNSHLLRPYQRDGLDWLVSMHDRRLNGILADEMGLGKTIQTIALLAHLASSRSVWGPHLIVVPTSTILNWETELRRWCPAFKVLTYYGTLKERKAKRIGWTKPNAFHVCVTSYQTVLADSSVFRRKKWYYLILDEAHYIKNYQSQRWQTLLTFSSRRRLLLTGTPLQNSLMELWSLMHFLMPTLFKSQAEFRQWFSNPLTQHVEGTALVDRLLVKRLHAVLRPFILRRLKSEVAKQMPKKYEHLVMCRMSTRQRFLYEDFMSRSATRASLEAGNFMSMMNVLMQLRKVCNHPDLFEPRPIVTPMLLDALELVFPSQLTDPRCIAASYVVGGDDSQGRLNPNANVIAGATLVARRRRFHWMQFYASAVERIRAGLNVNDLMADLLEDFEQHRQNNSPATTTSILTPFIVSYSPSRSTGVSAKRFSGCTTRLFRPRTMVIQSAGSSVGISSVFGGSPGHWASTTIRASLGDLSAHSAASGGRADDSAGTGNAQLVQQSVGNHLSLKPVRLASLLASIASSSSSSEEMAGASSGSVAFEDVTGHDIEDAMDPDIKAVLERYLSAYAIAADDTEEDGHVPYVSPGFVSGISTLPCVASGLGLADRELNALPFWSADRIGQLAVSSASFCSEANIECTVNGRYAESLGSDLSAAASDVIKALRTTGKVQALSSASANDISGSGSGIDPDVLYLMSVPSHKLARHLVLLHAARKLRVTLDVERSLGRLAVSNALNCHYSCRPLYGEDLRRTVSTNLVYGWTRLRANALTCEQGWDDVTADCRSEGTYGLDGVDGDGDENELGAHVRNGLRAFTSVAFSRSLGLMPHELYAAKDMDSTTMHPAAAAMVFKDDGTRRTPDELFASQSRRKFKSGSIRGGMRSYQSLAHPSEVVLVSTLSAAPGCLQPTKTWSNTVFPDVAPAGPASTPSLPHATGAVPARGSRPVLAASNSQAGAGAAVVESSPGAWSCYSSTLRKMVRSFSERLDSMTSVLDRFVFIIPKATAPTPRITVVGTTQNPSAFESKRQTMLSLANDAKELTHNINMRMAISFPDRRLVQYDCGKLQALDKLLRDRKSGGHRCLIFTQMTRMLDVLETFLNLHDHTYLRLDGSTKVDDRQRMMERFNRDPKMFVFILSTRSGGLGINLVGADTVIFYDSDWNPSMDAQAQDRAHRIGQTRDVHIYRLITESTIEENILLKAKQKRHLQDLSLDEGEFTMPMLQNLSVQDILGSSAGDGRTDTAGSAAGGSGGAAGAKAKAISSRGGAITTQELASTLAALEDEADVEAAGKAAAEAKQEMAEFDESSALPQENGDGEGPTADGDDQGKSDAAKAGKLNSAVDDIKKDKKDKKSKAAKKGSKGAQKKKRRVTSSSGEELEPGSDDESESGSTSSSQSESGADNDDDEVESGADSDAGSDKAIARKSKSKKKANKKKGKAVDTDDAEGDSEGNDDDDDASDDSEATDDSDQDEDDESDGSASGSSDSDADDADGTLKKKAGTGDSSKKKKPKKQKSKRGSARASANDKGNKDTGKATASAAYKRRSAMNVDLDKLQQETVAAEEGLDDKDGGTDGTATDVGQARGVASAATTSSVMGLFDNALSVADGSAATSAASADIVKDRVAIARAKFADIEKGLLPAERYGLLYREYRDPHPWVHPDVLKNVSEMRLQIPNACVVVCYLRVTVKVSSFLFYFYIASCAG